MKTTRRRVTTPIVQQPSLSPPFAAGYRWRQIRAANPIPPTSDKIVWETTLNNQVAGAGSVITGFVNDSAS